MYGWAPLAIMGEEINKLAPSPSTIPAPSPYSNPTHHHPHRNTEDPAVEMSLMSEHDPPSPSSSPSSSSPSLPPPSSSLFYKSPHEDEGAALEDNDNNNDVDGGMAGIYLGIHNIFATIPQFLATFVSMVVFSVLEPGQSPELSAAAAGSGSAGGGGAGSGGGGEGEGGLSGTAVCLAIGAVFQFVAAAKSLRMRRYGR